MLPGIFYKPLEATVRHLAGIDHSLERIALALDFLVLWVFILLGYFLWKELQKEEKPCEKVKNN